MKENKSQKVGYKGQALVEVRLGKKVLKRKKYKNNGRLPLFNFCALSLGGRYREAEVLRPKFIRIFSIGRAGEDPVPDSSTSFDTLANNTTNRSLIVPVYASEPLVEGGDITIKWVIPFSQLKSYANLNMLAMYSENYKEVLGEASAFIIIKDNNDGSLLGDLLLKSGINPSEITPQNENNYNLFVEWKLSFVNVKE